MISDVWRQKPDVTTDVSCGTNVIINAMDINNDNNGLCQVKALR
jgi:hypothetical protein